MKKMKKTLALLMSLALCLSLLPALALQAAATEINENTVEWSGEMTVTGNVSIYGKTVTAADGTVLRIAEGATLALLGDDSNGAATITVGDGTGTLTVAGPGRLFVKGADGFLDGDGADPGIKGNLTVTGGEVSVYGGSGKSDDLYEIFPSAAGVVGDVTVNGGDVYLTGGDLNNAADLPDQSAGCGVRGSLTVNGGRASVEGGSVLSSNAGVRGLAVEDGDVEVGPGAFAALRGGGYGHNINNCCTPVADDTTVICADGSEICGFYADLECESFGVNRPGSELVGTWLLAVGTLWQRVCWSLNGGTLAALTTVTVNEGITAEADTTLNIPQGRTLRVNGTLTVGDGTGTLAVTGGGVLIVEGCDYEGASGDGADAVRGSLAVDMDGTGTVTLTGGDGDTSRDGGAGLVGTLTVSGGTVTATGGKGGGGASGVGGDGVLGHVTAGGGTVTVKGGAGGSGVRGKLTVYGGAVAVSGGKGGAGAYGNSFSGGYGGCGGCGGIGVTSDAAVSGGTLTVTAGDGGDGGPGTNTGGHGGTGGWGVFGGLAVAGGTVTVTAGAGGDGGDSSACGGAGGDGGPGVANDVGVSGGMLTLTGGSGGDGGSGGSPSDAGYAGSSGMAFSRTLRNDTEHALLALDGDTVRQTYTGDSFAAETVYAPDTEKFGAAIDGLTLRPARRVEITAGAGMAKTDASGAAAQDLAPGAAMTAVVYEAQADYYFPADYAVAAVNGVSVERNSAMQITVSGTPASDAAITLAAATEMEQVAAPAFGPAAGAVRAGAEVTISCATAGATIYYTTDGTAPTASGPVYDGAISVDAACTLKAIAVKENMKNSDVAEAAYTLLPTYAVTVENGTGGGDYYAGDSVTVTADAAPAGRQFSAWIGADGLTFTSGGAYSATATFTMPERAAALTATYEEIVYDDEPEPQPDGTVDGKTYTDDFSAPLAFEGGDLTLTPAKPGVGSTVDVAVESQDGYQLARVDVERKDGAAVGVNHRADGSMHFTMPAMPVCVEGVFMPVPEKLNAVPPCVLSPQRIMVNGVEQTVEAYNVNGTNFFRIRDLAALLRGTPAQFNVEYDESRNAVVISVGQSYAGDVVGNFTDNSASAVVSPQSVEVDGRMLELTALNVAGSNFFGLRELSAVLGYGVDYDPATNTVQITSK